MCTVLYLKQAASAFSSPCVPVGAAPSQAALFEFRSQADGFLAGLRSRSQPRRKGSIRARAPVSYTCMRHWHWLVQTHTQTQALGVIEKGVLNHVNACKYIQDADTDTYGRTKNSEL